MAGFKGLIEPMTLGNMGADGVWSLDVSCPPPAIMSADPWPDEVPVPRPAHGVLRESRGRNGSDH